MGGPTHARTQSCLRLTARGRPPARRASSPTLIRGLLFLAPAQAVGCARAGLTPRLPARPPQLPVSTTHSVVGSVVGMSMVAAGVDSVIWSKEKDSFPFLSGMSAIVSVHTCERVTMW